MTTDNLDEVAVAIADDLAKYGFGDAANFIRANRSKFTAYLFETGLAQEVERLRRIAQYATHTAVCQTRLRYGGSCDCGYDAALTPSVEGGEPERCLFHGELIGPPPARNCPECRRSIDAAIATPSDPVPDGPDPTSTRRFQ